MNEPVPMSPIGILRTPHTEACLTPIQPCFAESVRGEAQLLPGLEAGLQGLETFSHVWLVYHLHQAGAEGLVVKPYLSEVPKGVFACRYPHRPNAIGLSLVRLLGIEGSRVVFTGADMLDGTPLLDIKPYFPNADQPENAWGGWTEALDREEARRIGTRRVAADSLET